MSGPPSFDPQEMAGRLARVRAEMAGLGLDAIIITDAANIRYATGFRGEPRTLLITADRAILYTSQRTFSSQLRQSSTCAGSNPRPKLRFCENPSASMKPSSARFHPNSVPGLASARSRMAFTVEAGIYIENEFGVRTEDDVVVTEDGNTRLTKQPADLLEISA